MGKQFPIIALVFVALAGLALVLAGSAAHRGQAVMVIVLLFAALLLWKRSQRTL